MDARSRRRLAGSFPLIAALMLCFLVPRANAQYMYLDSNGDGVHTKADVVRRKGTTRIAVWLITDRNRDGTKVSCSTEATLTGFRLRLSAGNGTVRWGTFAPDPPVGTNYEAQPLDSFSCAAWYALPTSLPAGKHRLGTVTLAVVRGTPSVAILPAPPEYPAQGTRFFSGCIDFGLTPERVLDDSWHDVDGLPYGGRANTPPVLTAPSEFPVRAGSTATFRIEAQDRDGDPITFRTAVREGVEPPPSVRVRTVDPGHGDAVGEVVVTADSCTEGGWIFNLEASDGTWFDRKEVEAPVERVARPVPANPMEPARTRALSSAPHIDEGSTPSSWPAGEWEWTESPPTRTHPWYGLFRPGSGPVQAGTRRRLILGRDGSYALYALNSGRVRLADKGTYALAGEPGKEFIQFSGGGKYNIWKDSPDTLCLYPWRAFDAAIDRYVRVPSIPRHGASLDTLRLLEPLGHPRIQKDGSLSLNASMRDALRRHDASFRPYTVQDWPGPGNYEYGETQIPWALIGDFDGDLIRDVALYGHSGNDEIVVAVLSSHGNARVAEVARRHATKEALHPFLELIPRGTAYSPCWARKGAPDTDAIGIVSPGVARFDYGWSGREFIVYAPVP